MLERLKELLLRGTEAIVAVGLALLSFLAFSVILSWSFPQGTDLNELFINPRDSSTLGPARFEVEGPDETMLIATLEETRRVVLNKPANGIAWNPARAGLELAERHAVQTSDRASAVIAFGTGGKLSLQENSLVVLRELQHRNRRRPQRASVIALEGSVRGRVQSSEDEALGLEVVTAAGTAVVQPETGPADFEVQVNPDTTSTVIVRRGTAEVSAGGQTVAVAPNQTITVTKDEPPGKPIQLPPPPTLLGPTDGERLSFRTVAPELRFGWSPASRADAYKIEISRDPDFEQLVLEQTTDGVTLRHDNLQEGVYYWRVAGAVGQALGPASSARQLRLQRDTTPPDLQIAFPDGIVRSSDYTVRGRAEPGAEVYLGSRIIDVDASGEFELTLALNRGLNVVVVEAIDAAGNVTYRSHKLHAKY